MPDPTLLQRLKERKLVQWGLGYLAVALPLVGLVEVMAEPWGISLGAQRVIQILMAAGLLLTLILAWFHGEKGHQQISLLEGLLVALLLVGTGLGVALTARPDGSAPGPLGRDGGERATVVLLPFQNLSLDPDTDRFADGLYAELSTKLGRVSGLRLIPESQVEPFRTAGSRPTGPEIAQALDADFVLDGTVRVSGDEIRLNPRLLAGEGGEVLWQENLDRPYSVKAYIRIQERIAHEVAYHLGAAILPEEAERLGAIPTASLEAYELYLAGGAAFRRERLAGVAYVDDLPSVGLLE
jgi:serine/threonine-protein kinase